MQSALLNICDIYTWFCLRAVTWLSKLHRNLFLLQLLLRASSFRLHPFALFLVCFRFRGLVFRFCIHMDFVSLYVTVSIRPVYLIRFFRLHRSRYAESKYVCTSELSHFMEEKLLLSRRKMLFGCWKINTWTLRSGERILDYNLWVFCMLDQFTSKN